MKGSINKIAVRRKPALPSSHGAIVVELAFVTIVLLVIIAGAIGFGRTFWYGDALAKAARDGARLMSTWPVATINSVGVGAAQSQVMTAANAAAISPPLTLANVVVECMDVSFTVVGCVDGTEPENVRVAVTGFTITVEEWFPIINWSGLLGIGAIGLTPQTVMRYMAGGST